VGRDSRRSRGDIELREFGMPGILAGRLGDEALHNYRAGGVTVLDFDFSRLRRADQLVGGGAIALFVFLFFFNWYGVSSNLGSVAGLNVNVSKSGWDTFTNSRWIWLITIIVALVAVAVASGALKFESPVQLSVIVAGLGGLSTLLILYRIVHHPSASASYGSFHASVGIKIGIWLGLIAAAALTYGGHLAMQAEGNGPPVSNGSLG
jgi:hypothetical protein